MNANVFVYGSVALASN